MQEFDLTREEIEMIEKYRKIKKIDATEIQENINKFCDLTLELKKLSEKLFDLKETNNAARKIILENLDEDFLRDIYEVLEENIDEELEQEL